MTIMIMVKIARTVIVVSILVMIMNDKMIVMNMSADGDVGSVGGEESTC